MKHWSRYVWLEKQMIVISAQGSVTWCKRRYRTIQMQAIYSNVLLNALLIAILKMVLSVRFLNVGNHYVNIEVNLLKGGFLETCSLLLKWYSPVIQIDLFTDTAAILNLLIWSTWDFQGGKHTKGLWDEVSHFSILRCICCEFVFLFKVLRVINQMKTRRTV